MRDRLIELISQIQYMGGLESRLADHLLANGVIVPPCKAEDTVWFIDVCTTAEDYGKKFVNFSRLKRMSVDNEFVVLEDHSIVLWEDVFLTKEEAEQALKEREQ